MQKTICNIHPGSKRSNTDLYKYVQNTYVLENVDVVPDLGVHVDCLLKFDRHISLIVHKAMNRARQSVFSLRIVNCYFKLIVFMSDPY